MSQPPRVDFAALCRVLECFVYRTGSEEIAVRRIPRHADVKAAAAAVDALMTWMEQERQAPTETVR